MEKSELLRIKKYNRKKYENRLDSFKYRVESSVNYKILLDSLKDSFLLSQELYSDIYMYDLAMANYREQYLFMANYYCEYAEIKVSMIWERIFLFLAYSYDIELSQDTKKNTKKCIYDKLKKKPDFQGRIKELILNLNGNYLFKRPFGNRDNNIHDISEHLQDDSIFTELDKEYFKYKLNDKGIPTLEDEIYEEFVDKANLLSRENLKKSIKDIEFHLKNYYTVLDECINVLETVLLEEKVISIVGVENYSFDDINIDIKYSDRLYMRCGNIQDRLFNIRDCVTSIADEINKNPILVFDRPPTIQILEYNIDVAYRSVDTVRSLVMELTLHNRNKRHIDKTWLDAEITDKLYYHNYALAKIFSIFEKIAKLFYTRFELNDYQGDKKDLRNKDALEVIAASSKEGLGDLNPVAILKDIISSKDYEVYLKVRNRSCHFVRPEIILRGDNFEGFHVYMIKIMLNLLEGICELLECFEEGELNNLALAKMLREKGI